MLVANVRSRFTRADAHLVLALLAQSGEQTADQSEERLRDDGLDAILDDPRLLRAHFGNYALWLAGMFPDASSPERLMRQVRDEVRWKLA